MDQHIVSRQAIMDPTDLEVRKGQSMHVCHASTNTLINVAYTTSSVLETEVQMDGEH